MSRKVLRLNVWVELLLVVGIALLVMGADKCSTKPPGPPGPGPLCNPLTPGQTCCWLPTTSGWVKVPCDPPSDPPPTPSPGPTVSPSAPPSTPPTPPPTPPPTALDCPMGTGRGSGDQCRKEGSLFYTYVETAINAVVAERPEVFDRSDVVGFDGYRVLDPTRYHHLVVAKIRGYGYCSDVQPLDGIEEIAVKAQHASGNAFGEGYDIMTSKPNGKSYIWRGTGSYQGTCRPAWFGGGGDGTPSPPPSPIPSPSASAPPPTPSPCIPEPVPDEPVPLVQAGRCSAGTTRMDFAQPHENTGLPPHEVKTVCIAESICAPPPNAGGKCPLAVHPESDGGPTCIACEEWINYHSRWGRIKPNEWGFVTIADGPQEIYQADAFCRVYQAGVRPVRHFGDWTARGGTMYSRFNEVCAPKRKTCPSPPPSTPPSPPPTTGACPELTCIYAHVANIVVNSQTVDQAHACDRGCWVVLDSTPLFGRCNSNGRCNGEMHNACAGGAGHVHTPNPSDAGSCTAYRKCEDRRGYTWRRVSGPETRWEPRGGDEGRGFQAKIDTTAPGTYVWQVCKDQPRDALGVPVGAPPPDCTQVSFEVRP